MTKNAFIFSWDITGIESIIPITQYEKIEKQNLLNMISGKPLEKNNLDTLIRNLVLRATYNSQRHYEIYAIDCSEDLDKEFWQQQWQDHPQETADLIRKRGHKIYSEPLPIQIKII
jgi:hypothetical protein